MANPLELPSPNIQTSIIGGGGYAPSPIDKFISSLLEAKQAKGAEDERKARLAMQKQALDMARAEHQAKLDEAAHQRDLEVSKGKAAQSLLKIYGDALGSHAATTGQIPAGVQSMVGPSQPVQTQQGVQQQPQQAIGPQAGSQAPMQTFSQVVSSLPPEAIGDFIKSYRSLAEDAQQKVDQGKAFDEADRLTAGLLTPVQRDQLKVARALWQAGTSKEIYGSMLPQAQIELAKGVAEVRSMGNKRDADKAATAQLVRLGLVTKGQGVGTEYIVDGAAKMLYDYVADVKKDARKAAIDRAAQDRAKAVEGVEGTALEIAAMNPDWSASQIKQALKASPAYAGIPDGVISKAAFEAPSKSLKLNAPANETVAKARVVYGPGRAALATVNAMDAKGEALGIAARLAQTDKTSAAAGIGAGGAAAGALIGAPFGGIGAVPGAAVGGAIGTLAGGALGTVAAPTIRGLGRAVMSADQQRLWTAAQSLAASIYRPESGAAVTQEEVRQTLERYIPLSTDKPATRQLKRSLRDELDKTLANISGLPRELGKPILNALLSKQEQNLTNGSSW